MFCCIQDIKISIQIRSVQIMMHSRWWWCWSFSFSVAFPLFLLFVFLFDCVCLQFQLFKCIRWCASVGMCVCTSVMFTHTQSEFNIRRIQHADNHKARSNCKLEIRRQRRRLRQRRQAWSNRHLFAADLSWRSSVATTTRKRMDGAGYARRRRAASTTTQHSSVSRWKKCEKICKIVFIICNKCSCQMCPLCVCVSLCFMLQ